MVPTKRPRAGPQSATEPPPATGTGRSWRHAVARRLSGPEGETSERAAKRSVSAKKLRTSPPGESSVQCASGQHLVCRITSRELHVRVLSLKIRQTPRWESIAVSACHLARRSRTSRAARGGWHAGAAPPPPGGGPREPDDSRSGRGGAEQSGLAWRGDCPLPVLKHGPWSLRGMRASGCYEPSR